MLFVSILFWFIGFFLFLFIFWKKLKDDYVPSQVFTVAFLTLSGLLLGYFIGNKYAEELWFWTTFGTSFLFFFIAAARQKMKFFESFEAFSFTFLIFYDLYFIYSFLNSLKVIFFYAFLTVSVFVVFYLVINKIYKKFAWYKSGKLGFASVSTTGIFFLTRSLVALSLPVMISLGGKVDSILSGVVAFAAFLTLFNLSKRT